MTSIQTAADMLRRTYKAREMNLRKMGKAVGISFKTMQRYTTRESPIPLALAPKIAQVVFESLQERHNFILQCKNELSARHAIARQRSDRKMAFTLLASRFDAFAGESIMTKIKRTENDENGLLQVNISTMKMNAFVRVFEKRFPDVPIFEVRTDVGLVFQGDQKKDLLMGKRAMHACAAFCDNHRIPWYGLAELARRKVEDPASFNDAEIYLSSTRLLDVGEKDLILRTLRKAEEVIRRRNATLDERNKALYEIGLAKFFVNHDPSSHQIVLDALRKQLIDMIDKIFYLI